MTNAQWFLLVGGLLLVMGLTATVLKRSPITAAMVYLMVGLLVGPSGLQWFHFNPLKQSALLEVLTEVVVLISLFSAGVKMPVPFRFAQWRTPIVLATLSMSITVGLIAAMVVFVFNLPWGAGILLGAILAPTDPVLATDVQVRHPGDRDQLRFTLTCEAGMNDGSAFPFVMLGLGMLGLHELGDFGLRWVLVDVVWATAASIVIGVVAGAGLARLGWFLRRAPHRYTLLDDFLGLGLIGLVYGATVMVNAWGFLAVFFAAVALRQTEQRLAQRSHLVHDAAQNAAPAEVALVSEGSLIFKEHLERLSELLLVMLVGGTLFRDSWSWEAVGLALFVFVVVRPISVLIGLLGTRTAWPMRGMTSWFGVRGIGSLYYLMFAIQHGLPEPLALQFIQLTLIVVTLSIFVHGTSVKPLMEHVWQRGKRAAKPDAPP